MRKWQGFSDAFILSTVLLLLWVVMNAEFVGYVVRFYLHSKSM